MVEEKVDQTREEFLQKTSSVIDGISNLIKKAAPHAYPIIKNIQRHAKLSRAKKASS